jgi:7-keto-8-aminopelargonate synthetase-like enzyme
MTTLASALLFPSGYHANLAVCSTACEAGDLICSDALNHASLIDGLRLSRAQRRVIEHGNPRNIPADAALVVLEGLYSMDGDIPRFQEYPSQPWMMVDEAHAVGALGPQGRGAAAMQGHTPDIVVGTFGKAYGAAGAFVIGPADLRTLLINAGRSFIYTTAMPEPVAAMALAGMRLADDERRERLAFNASHLRASLTALGHQVLGSAHILPVVVGQNVMKTAERLLHAGVYAPGIRWPTVPHGQERIRFTVSSEHSVNQLDRIADAMGPA